MSKTWYLVLTNKLSIAVLIMCLFTLGACNLPNDTTAPTKAPELVFPTVAPTSGPQVVTTTPNASSPMATQTQSAAPANTATPNPPTAKPPTAIPPTAAPAATTIFPQPLRIIFATGATTGIINNTILPGEVQNYLVGAGQTQPLMISTDSLNHDITFSVTGMSDGKVLLHKADNSSSWQTMLAVTQDYLIQVYAGASKENYTLNVSTPARVDFDPGAISATRKGSTPGGYNVAYVLRANINQQMDITLSAPAGNAVLSVYGYQDGNPYLRYVVEQTTFSFKLPATQDYIVQVVPRAGMVTDYSITFTIK